MKVLTLVENLVYQKGLIAEHGLSFFFEIDSKSILLDVGQSDAFYKNAQKMGINIENIDYLILSHGHYDHTGGINTFLEHNKKAKVILKKEALLPKYRADYYIGMPTFSESYFDRFIFINDIYNLTESVKIFPNITEKFAIDNHKKSFSVKVDGNVEDDNFDDELFVGITNNNEFSIISSCSHNGITNILEQAKQYFGKNANTVLGGYHLKNSSKEIIDHIIQYFNKERIKKIGFSHCSGIENYSIFSNKCDAEIFYNYTGSSVEL